MLNSNVILPIIIQINNHESIKEDIDNYNGSNHNDHDEQNIVALLNPTKLEDNRNSWKV